MGFCRTKTLLGIAAASLGLASPLAGCGAKGDLYLPAPAQPQRVQRAQESSQAPTAQEQPPAGTPSDSDPSASELSTPETQQP